VKVLVAFLVGGALCVLAQLILDLSKVQPAHVMVLFVILGAVASGLGLYGPLVQKAGAGASIPLAGFGHTLVQGIAEDVAQKGLMGLFTGGLRAASLGLSVAVIFAWLMSVLFNPRG